MNQSTSMKREWIGVMKWELKLERSNGESLRLIDKYHGQKSRKEP